MQRISRKYNTCNYMKQKEFCYFGDISVIKKRINVDRKALSR